MSYILFNMHISIISKRLANALGAGGGVGPVIYNTLSNVFVIVKVAGKEGLTCQAVEVVGGYRVGCKNKITRSEIVKTSQESDPVSRMDWMTLSYSLCVCVKESKIII